MVPLQGFVRQSRDCVYRCCATISALCFRKSSLQDQSGGGGQLCFILTIDIINNHLPHITIILSILLPRPPQKKKNQYSCGQYLFESKYF